MDNETHEREVNNGRKVMRAMIQRGGVDLEALWRASLRAAFVFGVRGQGERSAWYEGALMEVEEEIGRRDGKKD